MGKYHILHFIFVNRRDGEYVGIKILLFYTDIHTCVYPNVRLCMYTYVLLIVIYLNLGILQCV